MPNKNDSDYIWSIAEVRMLDNKLNELADEIRAGRVEIRELKDDINELKRQRPLVVDNRNKTDWKAIGVIVGATVASAIVALQQFGGN